MTSAHGESRGEQESGAQTTVSGLSQLPPMAVRPDWELRLDGRLDGRWLSLSPAPPVDEWRDDVPRLPTIDLTATPESLWQRLRNGFGMPDLHSPLVAERQAWYLNRPEMLQRIFQRSRRYLFHIVDELERRGMPTELALLPMVESAFNPLAYSRARALGIWQFIPSTGKNYKLEQNWWLDQRRDIIASTSAALDYLQYIYEMHGDWHLALASYNWGEGAVARAIAKNQARGLPTDYASLSMPDETRYYVPKLQALKNIVADPELFGITLPPIANQPYFALVDMPADLDVALAARLAGISLEEFIALNPAWHRPVIPGSHPAPLVLPRDKVDVFLANLEAHEAADRPLSSWRTYSLRKGDRLEKLAEQHGITLARLRQINGLTPRMKIGPGHTLLLPRPGAQPDMPAALPSVPGEPPGTLASSRLAAGKAGKGGGKASQTSKAKGRKATKPAGKITAKAASKPKAKVTGKAVKPPARSAPRR